MNKMVIIKYLGELWWVFRNETHHRISDNLTREDAMKIVAFIDSLLSILDKTTNND